MPDMPRKYYNGTHLALSPGEAQFLIDRGIVRYPCYNRSEYPYYSVSLLELHKLVGWLVPPIHEPNAPNPEFANEAQFLLDVLQKRPRVAQAAIQAKSDPFYEDRLRKLREVNTEARQLVAAAAQENVAAAKPLPPAKTRGDQAVDAARDKSLEQIDAAVETIGLSARLLKKIGTDAEVRKALDEGVKAFEPYRKLRKKGRG